jgi:phage baseplate assembly protein W
MARQKSFRGFSTIDAERTMSWVLTDIDLIKRDLLNHFMTRIGERVMRPNFGSRIWDLLDEQLTSVIRQEIIDDAVRICQSDPRVKLVRTVVVDFDQGVRVENTLEFLGWGIVDTMFATFQKNQSIAYSGD